MRYRIHVRPRVAGSPAFNGGQSSMRFLRIVLMIFIGSLLWIGASLSWSKLADAEDSPADSAAKVSFESDIQPLFKSKCWKCHGASVQKGELALHTPAMIQKGSESGAVVVAGNS